MSTSKGGKDHSRSTERSDGNRVHIRESIDPSEFIKPTSAPAQPSTKPEPQPSQPDQSKPAE